MLAYLTVHFKSVIRTILAHCVYSSTSAHLLSALAFVNLLKKCVYEKPSFHLRVAGEPFLRCGRLFLSRRSFKHELESSGVRSVAASAFLRENLKCCPPVFSYRIFFWPKKEARLPIMVAREVNRSINVVVSFGGPHTSV